MILSAVLETDGVEHNVRVDMLTINMCCHHAFVFPECFFCKFNCNLMCKLRWSVIAFRKTLHQMIIHPTAVLVVSILRCKHFIVSS